MSSQFVIIPFYGDGHWQAPVATASLLPTVNNQLGEARIAQDTGTIYVWDGSAWVAEAGGTGVSSLNTLIGALTLAAGTNISITPSGGNTLTIDATGGGTGTVTSVALADSTNIFNITGSPITGSGTLTLSSLKSQAANTFLAAPNGSSGAPTFRTILAADVPTLNQNTTGTASNVTGTVAIAHGGTGQITQQLALNAIAGAVSTGLFLRGDGTNVTLSAIQAADVPTLNQNTTGTAANITATSNSTLTTLSALSLPFVQLSGQATLSQLPTIADQRILGNNTGGNSTPIALTDVQVTAMLNLFTSSLQGLVPASGGGTTNFLRADGSFATPPGSSYTFADSLVNSSGTVTLVNDSATPGNTKYYGTDSGGTLGYYSIPATGVTSVGLSDASTVPIYNISGSPVTSTGTLTFTLASQSANTVLAGPTSGGATQPGFRALVSADIPNNAANTTGTASNITASSNTSLTSLANLATVGTITSGTWGATTIAVNHGGTGQTTAAAAFAALSPLTTKGDIIYEDATPTPVRLAIGSTGNVLTVSGGVPVWAAPATAGTVTSVAMTVPAFLSVSGSPITSSGTLAVTLSGTALPIANGGTGQTTAAAAFSALSPITTTGDMIYSSSGTTAARLPIGSTGNVLTVSGGVPTWAAPATAGTVTSVAMTVPTFLSVSGSPVTSSGTLAVTLSGTALPLANGGTGQTTKAAAFDALSPMTTGGDIIYGGTSGTGTRLANGTSGQVLTSSGGTSAPTWQTPGTGSGTVTSVGLADSTGVFNITNTPVTTSGTLTLANLVTQTANYVLAGPTGGTTPQTTTFTSGSGNFTVPAGYAISKIELYGGGGGGGGGSTGVPCGGSGGGGGAYCAYVPATNAIGAGTVIAYSVGGAGTAGTSSNPGVAGGAGGDTTVSTYSLTAHGGGGGQTAAGPGGAGGTASGGTTNTSGTAGTTNPVTNNGSNGGAAGGAGGGAGGTGINGPGNAGTAPGGGGAGGASVNSGGAGAVGQVTFTYVGVTSFRALISADIPTLNQNTTGTAANITASSNSTLTTLSALTTANSLSSASSLATVGTITSGTWSATTIAINHGGTGQTTAAAAFSALSPITTTGDIIYSSSGTTNSRLAVGSTGNVLTVSGGVPVWAAPATSGTVTSVAMSVPAFLSVSGSPITSSGTLAVTLSGTALPVANGGTGQTTASAAFNALSPITTTGDIIYSSSGTTNSRLAIGSTNNVLTVVGGVPSWQPASGNTIVPTVQQFIPTLTITLTGTANATAGATYTNNGYTLTVVTTISGGSTLTMSGSAQNIQSSGTLTKASGTGDSTIAYTSFVNASQTYTRPTSPTPLYLRVVVSGGGGAGGANFSTSGNNGGNTTFGSSLITCNGGSGGTGGSSTAVAGGTGGTATATGLSGIIVKGGSGSGGGGTAGTAPAYGQSGAGGSNPLGGAGGSSGSLAGTGTSTSKVGVAAAANTGAGGSGGAIITSGSSGSGGGGGGAGGYVDVILPSPSSSYAVSVGFGGGQSNNADGGAGGGGIVTVYEFYA